MVASLAVAGRHRFLLQAVDKGSGGGVTVEKAGDRIGFGLASDGVWELRPQERQKVLGRPRGKPLD